MGIWDRITGQAGAQFLDVIQWLDDSNDTLVYRFPVHDQPITDQSKVIVREGQAAVFVAEGRLSDVFAPGTYTLDTPNSPIWSFFRTIAYALENPYKGDILFVSTRQFTDNGWGTQNPFMMRDAEFGPVRVRAFGTYSFRVTDPATFIRQIVGTDGLFQTDEITGQLKKQVVSSFSTAVGQARIPVLDLVASYQQLGDMVREQINPKFQESYGISLTDLTVGNISLPKEVEQALDNRSKMGILGDLNAYTRLKAGDALGNAAANPGMAGAGMGLGMGAGMGHAMAGAMVGAAGAGGQFNPHQGMQGPPSPAPPPLPSAASFHYNGAGGQGQFSADDIAAKVAADRGGQHLVWSAGWPGWKPWSEVPEIAGKVPPAPSAPPPLPSAVVFHYAGPEGQSQKTADEVAAAIAAAPGGKHMVWKQGFDGWKPAAEVPEIVAAMGPPSDGPPPPPPM
jgi:membrane protease subunit (stomatin/prohibitin family)